MGRYDAALFDSGFAIGSMRYEDSYPGNPQNPRIVVNVATERNGLTEQTTQMIVDTGATWCILHPEIAESWGISPTQDDPCQKYRVRGTLYDGRLVKGRIILLATTGQNLAAEVTFFIPNSDPEDPWSYPNFLGYDSFLAHIRIAIDARENTLYFGSDIDG
jgi:Aspartyl protease